MSSGKRTLADVPTANPRPILFLCTIHCVFSLPKEMKEEELKKRVYKWTLTKGGTVNIYDYLTAFPNSPRMTAVGMSTIDQTFKTKK